jgi:hypothetical protein
MGMNKELIGKKYGPADCEVNKHEAMYYALASNDYNEAYINGRREEGIVAPPMYIVSKEIGGRVISKWTSQCWSMENKRLSGLNP